MKENLPDKPLNYKDFAREMSLSTQRLIRVINNISPPLGMFEGDIIPVSEYERLYDALQNEESIDFDRAKKSPPNS